MNAATHIRRTIRAARTMPKALCYRTLNGLLALWVDQGRLIRTGDLLDRLGADDMLDGYKSWYGRHVVKAYRADNQGAEPLKVWTQHRTTGKWIDVHVYNPTDPALYAGLRSYKRTAYLTATEYAECA